jgi:UDP-N-acetylglucosamine diphosphorylase/glucosamine-1-phosphate N-acetyltransferase
MTKLETTPFSIIILAAGKGKRMNNPDIPKVLVELKGKPLISYVLEEAELLKPSLMVIIVGFHKDKVINYLNSTAFENIKFVEQTEQLGTGHAVAQAERIFQDYNGNNLILCGDVPLLSHHTLEKFIEEHNRNEADLSVLTTIAPNPKGYGRIIRDINGNFNKIVEEKDASDEERKTAEINSGVYFIKSELLFNSLKEVSNKNAQGEYYLTDIVDILFKKKARVLAFNLASFSELQGINSQEDLKNVENMLN